MNEELKDPFILYLEFSSNEVFTSEAHRTPMSEESIVLFKPIPKQVLLDGDYDEMALNEALKTSGKVLSTMIKISLGNGVILNILFGYSASSLFSLLNGL